MVAGLRLEALGANRRAGARGVEAQKLVRICGVTQPYNTEQTYLLFLVFAKALRPPTPPQYKVDQS